MTNKWTIKKVAANTVNVKMDLDEYVELLEIIWNSKNDKNEVQISLFPKLIEFLYEVPYSELHSPKTMIDRFNNQAEVKYKSEFEPNETYETWEEYCSDNAVIYNDEYAIIEF